jgi:SAM-dependent methyltransferase
VPDESERDVWNRRFRERRRVSGPDPSPYLVECLPTVLSGTAGRRALDVACGEGRNSIYLARNGFRMTGVDNSDVALDAAGRAAREAGLDIDFRLVDLRVDAPTGVFDLVIMMKFLLKPLIPKLYDLAAPGGFLLLEVTLDAGDEGSSGETGATRQAGTARHNPEFMVACGELESIFAALPGRVVDISELPEREKARILFRKA